MAKTRSKRKLKKYLRARERQINPALFSFLSHYDFSLEPSHEDPTATPKLEEQFRLLLRLRWLVYDYLCTRLKVHPSWRKKCWFLELFDVDEVRIENGNVFLRGDIVWWAEGKHAEGEWWPSDHTAHPSGVHKVKMRGDLDGGKWIVEPLEAILTPANVSNRDAKYKIEFGYGSTYLKITNFR